MFHKQPLTSYYGQIQTLLFVIFHYAKAFYTAENKFAKLPNTLIHLINSLRRGLAIRRLHTLNVLVLLCNIASPAKGILRLAQLDGLELGKELQASSTGILLLIGNKRNRLRLGVRLDLGTRRQAGRLAARNGANGHKSRSRAGGHDLCELGELSVLDGALLDLPAPAAANLLHAVASDTVNDAVGVGHDESDVVFALGNHTDEATGAELVNLLVARAVQMQSDAVSLGTGLVAPAKNGRIVAADLGIAGSLGGGAVKVVQDKSLDGVRAVVDTSRHDKDAEGILFGGGQAQLRAGAVELWANIQRSTRLVRRDKAAVESDGGAASLDKHVDGDMGHGGNVGRVLQAHGVLVGAENGEAAVLAGHAEGLEALVGLLAVVEGGRHAMEAHIGVGDELERRPLASGLGVGRFDVSVDCAEKPSALVAFVFRHFPPPSISRTHLRGP